MLKNQYFSPEGLEKLKKELEDRKYVLRKEIAAKIVEAKDLGDLAENAEFTEAKEMQAFNEGRIEELENVLKHAQLISKSGEKLWRLVLRSKPSLRLANTLLLLSALPNPTRFKASFPMSPLWDRPFWAKPEAMK